MKISKSSRKCGNVRLRGKDFARAAACWMLVAQLVELPIALAEDEKSVSTPTAASAANDPVLKAIQSEIAPATAELGRMEQPPYYLSYTVYDQDFVVLAGAYGRLMTNRAVQRRFADGTIGVGAPELS